MVTTPLMGETVQAVQNDNDPTTTGSAATKWTVPWVWIAFSESTAAISATFQCIAAYTSWGWCGVAVTLTGAESVPNIPYPANQTP